MTADLVSGMTAALLVEGFKPIRRKLKKFGDFGHYWQDRACCVDY